MATLPQKRKLPWLFASLVLAATLAAGLQIPVSASISSNMAVSATVTGACSGVTANPLAFGNVTGSSSNVDTTTTVTFTCSSGTPWSLDSDTGSFGSSITRSMMFGAEHLPYALYKDSTFTNQWGSVILTGSPFAGMGTGAQQSVIVYGRIPAGHPTVSVGGPYVDTVSVTLTF